MRFTGNPSQLETINPRNGADGGIALPVISVGHYFEATADNETALYRRYATICSAAARWTAAVGPRTEKRFLTLLRESSLAHGSAANHKLPLAD